MTTPRTGALLIHGLGGTEFDMGSLHKVLARAGVQTHGVTLPGHAGRPEDLLDVRVEDWMDVVTRRYRELCEQYEVVHVIGMCLGALLAVELCKRESHTRGALVSLSAPVFLDGWSTPWYRGLRYLLYHVPGVPRRIRVEEEDPYGRANWCGPSSRRALRAATAFTTNGCRWPACARSIACAAWSSAAWSGCAARRW